MGEGEGVGWIVATMPVSAQWLVGGCLLVVVCCLWFGLGFCFGLGFGFGLGLVLGFLGYWITGDFKILLEYNYSV